MRFGLLFRELAERETRTVKIFDPLPVDDPSFLPVDEYGFDEWYCVEPRCDCRRVMINVVARHAQAHAATINHGFDPPGKDDLVPDQTFLDPLNRQSRWSAVLLDLFANVVLADESYRQRLLRHYHLFKNAVDDPAHPCQRLVRGWADPAGEPSPRTRKRVPAIPPPPPRCGKRNRRR